MQKSECGETLRLTVFGESHGDFVGAELSGLPAGIPVSSDGLLHFMKRRQGGKAVSTSRAEEDRPLFDSGLSDGFTDGTVIRLKIPNGDVRSKDYDGFRDMPRPSHADYTAQLRYGSSVDLRGGGHFSGRLTAPLCAVGYICLSYLEQFGIKIGAHLLRVGSVRDAVFDPVHVDPDTLDKLKASSLSVLDQNAELAMAELIEETASHGDSVGGIVECAAIGVPGGIGNPLFDGIENRISSLMFGLGGVRGIEFGDGFRAASMTGSEHNDPFTVRNGKIETMTNHSGGIQGGISNGMPIVFRVAFKPTASIGLPQHTVSLSKMENAEIEIRGRHDPCIAVRAVPCVEAVTAIALTDLILTRRPLDEIG